MTATPQIIQPANIQKKLNEIWESIQTTHATRASLFNLIFYTHTDHRSPYIQRLANNVIKKFPARVIFVTLNTQSEKDYLTTEVSIQSANKGEYDVVCDFIRLEAGGASQERIPFVILPHILPDLPVYLAWAEDPCHDVQLFNQLEKFSNRLIFDSESTNNLPLFTKKILEMREKSSIDIADLNWARIESWRDILSSTFYESESLEKIKRAKRINITYNAKTSTFFSHTPIQSFYLQAWLACQLDWKFQKITSTDKNHFQIVYQTKDSSLEINMIPMTCEHLPPGLILSTEIFTTLNEHFSFNRNLEIIEQITLNISTPTECAMPCKFLCSKVEAGHSLVKEIYHRGTSEHFVSVLNLVKQMEGVSLC